MLITRSCVCRPARAAGDCASITPTSATKGAYVTPTRPCSTDQEPLPERAAREAPPGVELVRAVAGLRAVAGPGIDPQDAHVAAEREHRKLVLGLAQLHADERPPVAEREADHLDVEQLR